MISARHVALLVVCGLSVLGVGCSALHSWGDDHIVLNELPLLEENDLWFELLDQPAESIECNIALCQNLLRSMSYEVTGDFEVAKEAAVAQLLKRWVPIDDDPRDLHPGSTLFQLRDDVEIDTTTGTAYLRLSFDEDWQFRSITVDAMISVTVSSELPV